MKPVVALGLDGICWQHPPRCWPDGVRDLAPIEALHNLADLIEDDDLAVAIVQRLDAIAEESIGS